MTQKYKVYDTTPYIGMTLLQMLTQFHNKFGTPYDGPARELSKAELAFRQVCHVEEAKEYRDAVAADPLNLVDQLDALGDELYFLTGTAHRQGFGPQVTEVSVELGYKNEPRSLNPESYSLRYERHGRVLAQYEKRAALGDLSGMMLALNEAIRAFRATAHMQGFDIDEALRRIHAANMTKNTDPAKQRRTKALAEEGLKADHMLEITKPDGWLPPYLGDLVGQGPYVEPEECQSVPHTGKVVHLEKLRGLVTIDGPDASGKSTLAARIAELTGGQVIHLTWSKHLEEVMDEYRTAAIRYAQVLAHHCVVVLERPWLSHPIYAEVYRNGVYDRDAVRNWKLQTEQAALLNIVALPGNPEEWLTNYLKMCDEREELHGPNPGKARAVYDGFRDAFSGVAGFELQPGARSADIPVEVFDMQQFTIVDIDRFIVEHVVPVLAHKE